MDDIQGMNEAAAVYARRAQGAGSPGDFAAEAELTAYQAESEAELKRLQGERAQCAEGISPSISEPLQSCGGTS